MGIRTIKSKILIVTYIGSYIKCTHNLNTYKDAAGINVYTWVCTSTVL